jgi:pyruvate/2-oxoglutarate dehydrogenase complex dihydrolipoamide acyltransferase (E2) component
MDVTLPRLADSLVEGIVTRWLKRPGERVARGEPLVEIETDKVNSEIESPYEGVLTEVLADEGDTVPVGRVIARIEEDASLPPPSLPEGEGRGGGAGADRTSGS